LLGQTLVSECRWQPSSVEVWSLVRRIFLLGRRTLRGELWT